MPYSLVKTMYNIFSKNSHGPILMREKKFKESQTTEEELGEGGG